MTTIKEVAERAGVSFKTVSRVLNNNPNVSADTRERVLAAVQELDYRPNFAARHMRTQRSQVIGLLSDEVATTPYAGHMIKGAQSQAWINQKLMLVVNTDGDPAVEEEAIEMMLERRVEGIIYAAMYHHPVNPPDSIREVPTVLLDCYVEDCSLPSVVPDEVYGGWLATKTLLDRGHQRIGFINLSPELNHPAISGRLRGYQQALAEHGLEYDDRLHRYSNTFADDGYRLAIELMQGPEPPTALFCGTDRLAMGAYEGLKELGFQIPDDVAVMGYDNQEIIAAYLRPPLSSIALPHYEMGQWAVQYLLEHPQVGLTDPVQHKIRCPLVERQSV